MLGEWVTNLSRMAGLEEWRLISNRPRCRGAVGVDLLHRHAMRVACRRLSALETIVRPQFNPHKAYLPSKAWVTRRLRIRSCGSIGYWRTSNSTRPGGRGHPDDAVPTQCLTYNLSCSLRTRYGTPRCVRNRASFAVAESTVV